jgi:hypothetical protein
MMFDTSPSSSSSSSKGSIVIVGGDRLFLLKVYQDHLLTLLRRFVPLLVVPLLLVCPSQGHEKADLTSKLLNGSCLPVAVRGRLTRLAKIIN